MSMIKTIGVWLLLLAAFAFVNQMDYEDAIAQEQHYCDMVKLYKQTYGRSGWPEYRRGEVFCAG